MNRSGRIGLREIRALKSGEIVWDQTLPGFAARRQTSEAVTYVLKYRTAEGRQRWYTIGRHGAPWTPDMARTRAQEVLGEVVRGADPATQKHERRKAVTVAELCDQYLAEALTGRVLKPNGKAKRRTTLEIDKGRIERHIKPLIGTIAVSSLTLQDVQRFLHDVADGKTRAQVRTKARGLARVAGGRTAANRCVGLLVAIFTYAVRQGLRPDNPVQGVQRFADGRRERRLSDDEYALMGRALVEATHAGIWPAAVAAFRFIAITGWRRGEVLGLRWTNIDLAHRTAVLGETKSGRSMRPLSGQACLLLAELISQRVGPQELIFPATRGAGVIGGFRRFWVKIAGLAGLPSDVTPHVLRHSFASLAADMGYSEPTIAALIGHAGRTITSRYTHTADAVLLAATDAVADETAGRMNGWENT